LGTHYLQTIRGLTVGRQAAVKEHVLGTVVILRLMHFLLPFLNAADSLVFRQGAKDADHLALIRAKCSKHSICYTATAPVSSVLFIQFSSIFESSIEYDTS